MKITAKAARKREGLSRYIRLGCPLTKSNSKWCYGMCKPVKGLGFCGRVAPHAIEGRTQKAIRLHKESKKADEKSCECERR